MDLIGFIIDVKTLSATIFGMVLQFFLGTKKNIRVAMTTIGTTLFLALFIVPAVIEFFGVKDGSKLAIAIYALSAFLSMEIIALTVSLLKEDARAVVKKWLGIEEEENDVSNTK